MVSAATGYSNWCHRCSLSVAGGVYTYAHKVERNLRRPYSKRSNPQ
ncbi:MAG: hypothetical protein QXT76_06150 [Sulfolobales archaeon]